MPSVKNDPEETVAAMFPVPWLTEASSRSCSANMPISCSMVCRPHLETTRCVSTSAARNACSRRIPNIAPVAPVIPTMIRLMVLSVVHARPSRPWKVRMNLRRDRSLDQSRSYNRPIGAADTRLRPLTMPPHDTPPAAIADSDYLSAEDAARMLRIKPQTLYTYVSRGLIRSVAQLDRKQRLYYREDVETVRARSV